MRPTHLELSFLPTLRTRDPLIYEDTGRYSGMELLLVLMLIADHVVEAVVNQTDCVMTYKRVHVTGVDNPCMIWIGRVDCYEVVCHLWYNHG